MTRKISITVDAREYDILRQYARVKAYPSIGAFARYAMEQAMNRSKVDDLHQKLVALRGGKLHDGAGEL